ncbi:MAG: hypothetical protein WB542_18105 [Polaromonas sp.]
MEAAQALTLKPIDKAAAAQAFSPCAGLDPDGIETPEGAANAGQCFRLEVDKGYLVLSVSIVSNGVWCHAAAGSGRGMTGAGLMALEQYARANDCRRVSFQTMRLGLVRESRRRGYEVIAKKGKGFVINKELQA